VLVLFSSTISTSKVKYCHVFPDNRLIMNTLRPYIERLPADLESEFASPLINTGKFPERSRERTLSDDELRVIWTKAGDDHYGSIVKLLMLTGQRADEMASLR
jgi:integrase